MKEREDATKEKGEKEEKEGKAKTMKQVTPVEIHEYNTVNASCSTRSKVEDEEDSEGEWTTYHGRGKGRVRGVRGRGTRGRVDRITLLHCRVRASRYCTPASR
ncbi:hypothetical protein GLOIN_2v1482155 [Rhizophagus irregularis DAOM 181602=DAOM 197198]|uniref:Uncharacterized protein n=1 Tax=Rhizophagus irregularis (strain DAOM 181602 / DAOM 197198 / MUCL 43194) TaxID=747089 RepID=U9UWT2_RHIID|nr:hypothetical protein GLOIN_2v1482155 [Rhizophagus irregularis DAOM 181602=DAOM 197198]